MALQPLFRLGALPTGAAAGYRGLFAFWLGGACVPSTTTPSTGGGIIVRRRHRKLDEAEETEGERRHRAFSEMVDDLEVVKPAEKTAPQIAKIERKAKKLEKGGAELQEFFAALKALKRLKEARKIALAQQSALRIAYRIEELLQASVARQLIRLNDDEEAMLVLMLDS